MKIVVYFSGQGAKINRDMIDYLEKFQITKKIYEIYKETLGNNLKDSIDRQILGGTGLIQPTVIAINHAIWEILKISGMPEPKLVAGHSLGEYSALVASEAISINDAISLSYLREKYMQLSCLKTQSSMLAIIGASVEESDYMCKRSILKNEVLDISCINTRQQVVISGHKNSVSRAAEFARKRKKSVRYIGVDTPSHSSLMKKAALQFEEAIKSTFMKKPKIPVIHNVDAKTYPCVNEIKNSLIKQLTQPVQWYKTVALSEKTDTSLIIECGYSGVLRDFSIRNIPFNCVKITGENLIKTIFKRI